VPAEHRRWIPQRDPRALEPDHPRKELLQAMVVVPAGADDDALELFPAHVGGIPHGRHLRDAEFPQWRDEQQVVLVQGRELGTGRSGVGKLRLAVVGSERAIDSTLYWFEVSFAGKDPGKSGVLQILTGSLASGLESPRALVFKVGPQPAMRISGEMAGMMGKQGGQNASAFDWAGKCSGAHVVGWESVTVPAGTFRALHVTTEDGGE